MSESKSFMTSFLDTSLWEFRREAVDGYLREFLEEEMRRYAGDALTAPLVGEMSRFLGRKGKRVRPLLFLHACGIFGVRQSWQSMVPLAGALELLHSFVLVHDDVIDRSDVRSSMRTMHKGLEKSFGEGVEGARTGRALAIVLGDVLFALAQKSVLRAPIDSGMRTLVLGKVLDYLVDTGIGECVDVVYGTWDAGRVGFEEVERMYWWKTTRYSIECPLVLAALLAGRPEKELRMLEEFSRPLGLAFQARNDLLALRQFEAGELPPDDFLEGKKTLLMCMAHARLGDEDRARLQVCLASRPVGGRALETMCELVLRSGAPVALEARVVEAVAEAGRVLVNAELEGAVGDGLRAVQAYLAGVLQCDLTTEEKISA